MPFFATLKKPSVTVWQTLKKVVIPTVISIGGIIANVGGSLFILPKFVKYITDKEDHPETLYASFVIILFTTTINLATRVPAILRHFRSNKNHIQEPVTLACTGKSIYLFLRINNYTSGGLMLLTSFLNAITFIEFLSQYDHINPHDNDFEYFTESTALILASCATAKYAIFTLKNANQNALYAANHIENGTLPHDRQAVATLAIASFGMLAVPFLSYFSTINALGKIPKVAFPQTSKYVISGISSVTNTVTYLVTQLPAVYISITHKNKMTYTHQPCWETPSKIVVYGIAGVGDFAITNISGFTSIVNTTHEVSGIDPKNTELIIVAVACALSNATLNYFFSVYRGYEETLKHYHLTRGDTYIAINNSKEDQESVAEKGELPKSDIYKSSPRLLLFSHADTSTQKNADETASISYIPD